MRLLPTLLCAMALWAPQRGGAQEVEVDLELVLMVDVSRSMSERELEIQRRGYAEALRSDVVLAAVRSGLLQSVAMTYIEWAGAQEVIVDWRLIKTREDLDAFADVLSARFDPALRRTSISEALYFGARALEINSYRGLRQVIDISGDGPNNQGRGVEAARDAALAKGIVINGLPLLTKEGMGADWHLDRLDIYYRNCVIGGPGSFVIPVLEWGDFAEAVRRKLVMEIAARPTLRQVTRVQGIRRDPTDCLIGEKIWQDRSRYWNEP